MRLLMLSDIHGNIDALDAVERAMAHERVDQIWVLGDLVDYGAAPAEVIAWVRRHAHQVVRGNHDHAVGTGDDCRSAPMYRDLAVATREYFRPRLSPADLAYLANLPLQVRVPIARDREGVLVHASPRDPLFGYIPTDSPDDTWRAALAPALPSPYVFVGHTHDQFARAVGDTLVVNPGSVGLPKDGEPRAAFAVFDDGRVDLRRAEYDADRAANRVAALGLNRNVTDRLAHLIRHAQLPS